MVRSSGTDSSPSRAPVRVPSQLISAPPPPQAPATRLLPSPLPPDRLPHAPHYTPDSIYCQQHTLKTVFLDLPMYLNYADVGQPTCGRELTTATRGVEQTARETIFLVERIQSMMASYKRGIRQDLPKIYSQDLLNNLFRHPYTKIEFVEDELSVTRKTASQYLRQLVEKDYLKLLKNRQKQFLSPEGNNSIAACGS